MLYSIAFFVFAFLYLSTSKIEDDVPIMLWSEHPVSFFHGDSISSPDLVKLVNDYVQEIKPKLVILYLEPQLRTYEVSLFNSEDSIFSKLYTELKNFKSVVIPYGQIDSTFVHSLFGEDRVPLVYFSDVPNPNFYFSFTEVKNFEFQLSNEKTTFLVIDLNHNGLSREMQFVHSGKTVERVSAMLNKNGITDFLSIYTGFSSSQSIDFVFEDALSTKRVISTVQVINNEPGIPWTNVTTPNWFNRWFPGYFWEILFVFLLFLSITTFGVCQLSQIQVPSKFPTPKKQSKNL